MDKHPANEPIIKFKRLDPVNNNDLPLPRYMTPEAAGMDVCAGVSDDTPLKPGEIKLIPTGFAMAVPNGYEAQIRPRSGLAVKHGLGIINSPGTIDSDYRGEVKIAVINLGSTPYTIKRKDRIAQMLLKRVYHLKVKVVEELDETDRNTGGFGHTGVS